MSGDRPDVDKRLGSNHVQVLGGHPLPNDPLHTAEANAELVLKQLPHTAQTAVAQMVEMAIGPRISGHTLAQPAVDPATGEILADAGETLTREKASTLCRTRSVMPHSSESKET